VATTRSAAGGVPPASTASAAREARGEARGEARVSAGRRPRDGRAARGNRVRGPSPASSADVAEETADVAIHGIAAGGDGVGRIGALVAFVPRTAPGDVARVALRREGRLARGRVLELLDAAPERVAPPCPHYVRDDCGGCQLQHLAYDAQRSAKAAIVGDALRRIGRRDVAPPLVHASPREWRYRRKLTLAMRRRGGRWIAGLHAYDRPGDVFALEDCPISDERVVAAWREVLAASRWLPDVPALRGAVRLLSDGVAFTLDGARRWATAERFFAEAPSLAALWWAPEAGARRLLHDRRATSEPGASFVQVNPEVAEALRAHVIARALAYAPAHVVDAYAGTGDAAVRLAERGVRVSAIEIDREAAAYAAARLPAGSRALAGAVEARIEETFPADVVVLNPPRGGLHARVPEVLEAAARGTAPPRALVYVSCNPATLARDLARLPSYAVRDVVAFDMFPQTAHVETVCELVPATPTEPEPGA